MAFNYNGCFLKGKEPVTPSFYTTNDYYSAKKDACER